MSGYQKGSKILFDHKEILKGLSKGEFLEIVCSKGDLSKYDANYAPKELAISEFILSALQIRELSAKEMASLQQRSGFSKPTFYLTLNKLISRGMVEIDETSKLYLVSLKFAIALRGLANAWEEHFCKHLEV